MVSGSRFASEGGRRVVLAVIMAVLLAGSTGLAALFSARTERRGNPAMSPLKLGAFQLNRPAKWSAQDAVMPSSHVAHAAAFTEPASDRLLLVTELRYPQPVSPDFALTEMLTKQSAEAQRIVQGQALRYGPMAGLLVEALPVRRGAGWKLLAVVTLDGRRYVAVSLNGERTPSAADLVLVYRIAESVKDTRYVPQGARLDVGGAAAVQVPAGLRAFELKEPGRPVPLYVLTPTSDERFFTLELTPLPVQVAGSENQPAGEPGAASVEQTLLPVLAWRYREMVHAAPPESALKVFDTDQARVLALPVGLTTMPVAGSRSQRVRAQTGYVEFWGIRVKNGRSLLLDITAAQAAAGAAQEAALNVAKAVAAE